MTRNCFVGVRSLLLPAVVLCTLFAAGAPASSAHQVPDESVWYGIQIASQQVGTLHVMINTVPFEGKPALLIASDTTTSITLLGISVTQNVKSSMYAQPDGQTPIYETVTMSSGGLSTITTARFYPDHIDATLQSGGETTPKRIPIPAGQKVAAMDATDGLIGKTALKKGTVLKELVFNPITLAIDPVTITVLDTDQVAQDNLVGVVKPVTICQIETPEGDATVYQDSAGTPVVMKMIAGLQMVRQAPPQPLAPATPAVVPTTPTPAPLPAPGGAYAPPDDFAVAVSVPQSHMAIDSPRTCIYLRAQLDKPGQPTSILEVRSSTDPEQSDGTVADAAADSTLAPYLSDAVYLSLDSESVRLQSKQIAGSATNLAQLVCSFHDWVNKHMTPVGTIGIPRAAASVLADPRGVCRDYAILYTALARSSGVPTRICGGIVAYKGRFYYHAWAESYVGKVAGWVSVDPTIPGRFVDATHVVLARGNPADMFSITSDIGKVKVTVLDTEN